MGPSARNVKTQTRAVSSQFTVRAARALLAKSLRRRLTSVQELPVKLIQSKCTPLAGKRFIKKAYNKVTSRKWARCSKSR